MKYLFLLIVTTLFSTNCNSQTVFIKGKEEISFDHKELNDILQSALNLNHIDFFFKQPEKEKGLTIVINDFVAPYYKNLFLKKI
ncbi:hypothetical protein [Aquimarina addita]